MTEAATMERPAATPGSDATQAAGAAAAQGKGEKRARARRDQAESLADERRRLQEQQAALAERMAKLEAKEKAMRERGIKTALDGYSAVLRRHCAGANLHQKMSASQLDTLVADWLKAHA